MVYEYEHSLRKRILRSVSEADMGQAVICRIQPEERAEALRLVGASPVIVATGDEALAFLTEWMAPIFKRKRW